MLDRLLTYSIDLDRPVFQQLSDGLIRLVNEGVLRPGYRLMGTRTLAKRLSLNRKTVVKAYEDAVDQGYLESRPGSGFYVSKEISARPRLAVAELVDNGPANFDFDRRVASSVPPINWIRLTEGTPDSRLSDLDHLYTTARQLLRRRAGQQLARYGDAQGDIKLREVLSKYLGESRGIPASPDRMIITRGSQQGFQLASRLLFRRGGLLAVAALSYEPMLEVAVDFGAELLRLPLDEQGLVVESLVKHPRLADVKAIYLTPHHQYPTTVTLSAERRLRLLDIAAEHGIAILEDDYDYDFHYGTGPLLPLAALDRQQSVVYLGSFTKVISPGLRIGYMLGPPDFIQSAVHHRQLGDRQGDLLLERALARYLETGDLQRQLRKIRLIYQQRRDCLSQLLEKAFRGQLEFQTPKGGMATWVSFPRDTDLVRLQQLCAIQQLWLSPSYAWWAAANAMRLGFASLNQSELEGAIGILSQAFQKS
ncbi:MAG: PLP-dependent aminotransferase family protein [Bacteroidota bacterium]